MPNHFLVFIKCVFLLTVITLGERLLFFAYDTSPAHGFTLSQLAYAGVWGLRFDLAVAGALALLVYLLAYVSSRILQARFTSVVRRTMYIAAPATVLLQGGDIMYFSETGRHVGYEILDFFNDAGSLLGTAFHAYLWTSLLHIALAATSLWLVASLFREPEKNLFSTPRRRAWHQLPELSLVPILLLAVILVRGGLQSVPQSPLSAQAIGDTRKATLALNGAYNALYFALSGSQVAPVKLTIPAAVNPQTLVKSLYPPPQPAPVDSVALPISTNPHIPYNVVTILLESWPAAFMKSYGFHRDVTPNFDALRKQSLTTYAMLAGGHRTTEGMFAVFCSAQNPLGQTVAQNQLQTFHYHCLPQILRDQGYYTAFFQGTNKNTSGTGVFAQMLGFTDSYGRKDVVTRKYAENAWGVHDPDLYNLALEKMRSASHPFFMGINTASTHDVTLPRGVKPFVDPAIAENPMLNVMHFADASLMNFINTVQNDTRIGPTVFVLVADHTAVRLPSNYQMYSIPFTITAPGIVPRRFVDRVASQRDISPTILDILGLSIPDQFTGKSLMRDNSPPYFADYYHNGILGWIEGDQLLEIPVVHPERYRCYDYRNDPLQSRTVTCETNAPAMMQQAIAFTATSQRLLFSGHLQDFAGLKAPPATPPRMTSVMNMQHATMPVSSNAYNIKHGL